MTLFIHGLDEWPRKRTFFHAMKKIYDKMAFLNLGQILAIAADQPLCVWVKQIHWKWLECGEDKFVNMFRGLYAALKLLGTLLQDCGWTSFLVEADVASLFTAKSFLPTKMSPGQGKHIRSQHAVCTN